MTKIGDSSDSNSSGVIVSKIKANMEAFLEKINKNADAIKVFDKNGDGSVTADELTAALSNSSQWGAFDEVSLQVGQDLDKNQERLKNDDAKAHATYNTKLQVNGANVVNKSTNDEGVNVTYSDQYNANGKLTHVEQKVSKKTDDAEHTVELVKYDNGVNKKETVTTDSQSYVLTSTHSNDKNASFDNEILQLKKNGASVDIVAFEHKDPDGKVTWEGVKMYANDKIIAKNE